MCRDGRQGCALIRHEPVSRDKFHDNREPARKFHGGGQFEGEAPTIARAMSIARRISVSDASSVRKAAWEVSVTFSIRASGWSGLSGSA